MDPTTPLKAARGLISPDAVPAKKKRMALGVAIIADAIQLGFLPFFAEGALSIPDDVLDVVTVLACLLILGFRSRLILALVAELVPAFTLFPSWTLAILSLPTIPEGESALGVSSKAQGLVGATEKVPLSATQGPIPGTE